MLPLVVVGCTSKQSVSRCVKPTTASGVDNAASPDWQTPLNRIISPSERGWSLCKNNWKEPRSILMSSADRVACRWSSSAHNYCEQYTRASSGVLKCLKSNKTEQSIYECLLGFCFNNTAPPQILAASTVFFCPIPETKKWWVMVSPLVLLLPVCLRQ